MAPLVEDVVSLEKEADSIVARARAEAKESEKIAVAEAEAYRQKLAEETDQRISAFQKEMEERHRGGLADAEKDLARALDAVDRIPGKVLEEQVNKIVTKFGER